MEKPYVFISYSTKDQEYADKVYKHLTANGLNVWMASHDIHGGEDFANEITNAVNGCDTFVFVMSKNSDDSPHCINELSLAFSGRKRIIPIRIEDFNLSKTSTYFLQRAQWVNAVESFESGLDEVFAQINKKEEVVFNTGFKKFNGVSNGAPQKTLAKKKVTIISIMAIAFVTAMVVFFTIMMPLINFSRAIKFFNTGRYQEAITIYQDLNGFRDSETKIKIIKALERIEKGSYEEGIKDIISNGAVVTISYDCAGGELFDNAGDNNIFTYDLNNQFTSLMSSKRNGYAYNGWSLIACLPEITEDKNKVNLYFKAEWTKKSFDITYDLAGGNVEGENYISYNSDDPTFTLINPTRKGYTFTGWTGTGLLEKTITVTIEEGSSGHRYYTANWDIINYAITYNLNGGSVSGNPSTYTVEDTFILNNPSKFDCEFNGWMGTGLTNSTIKVIVDKGSIGDRVYTATWSNESAFSFIFEGASDLTITGYIGNATSLEIPEYIEGRKVVEIDKYAFYGCASLTSVVIPNSVTSIGEGAFSGCSSLVSIELPNSVTSIGNSVFEDCDTLTSIEIPDSVTSIGASAFYNCSSLTSIEIPNSVTSIGEYAFYECSKLQYEIKDGLKYLGNSTNKYLYLAGIEDSSYHLNSFRIADGCRFIREYAFEDWIERIEIPNSVKWIGICAFCCDSETKFIFNGTTKNWAEISIEDSFFSPDGYLYVDCTDGRVYVGY